MWNLPGPGIEPVCPALAGRFLTIEPPGKPTHSLSIWFHWRIQGFLLHHFTFLRKHWPKSSHVEQPLQPVGFGKWRGREKQGKQERRIIPALSQGWCSAMFCWACVMLSNVAIVFLFFKISFFHLCWDIIDKEKLHTFKMYGLMFLYRVQYTNIITTIKIINILITLHSSPFFCVYVMRTMKIYPLNKFQVHSTVST